jgi:hypothetical protein
MKEKKQSDFVVSDKRKFTSEGELRPGAANDAPPSPAEAAPEPVAPTVPPPAPAAAAPAEEVPEPAPAPPTQAAAGEAQQSYRDSGKKIDQTIAAAGHPPEGFEVTFEHLLSSLYMTALMQLGLMHPEGAEPRLDLIGARSTIDTLALLEQKTRGNLTEAENKMLQHSLYELHLAFVEVTKALTRPPDAPPANPPRGGK